MHGLLLYELIMRGRIQIMNTRPFWMTTRKASGAHPHPYKPFPSKRISTCMKRESEQQADIFSPNVHCNTSDKTSESNYRSQIYFGCFFFCFFFMSLRQHASWYTIKTQEEMTTATAIPSDIKVSYTELGNIISLQVAYKLTILEKSPLFAFSPVELYVAVASIPEIRTMQSTGF